MVRRFVIILVSLMALVLLDFGPSAFVPSAYGMMTNLSFWQKFQITLNSFSKITVLGSSSAWSLAIPISVSGTPFNCASALSVSSSNTSLLMTSQVTLSGIYPSCMMTLNVAANATGSTTITVSATLSKVTVSQSFVLFVTEIPIAAYSLRRLQPGYTGSAINVRRSSDSTAMDIGFTSAGSLDTATLLSFVGTDSGYVTTWYDQSGNARNSVQSTAAYQPVIVNSGALVQSNNHPAISFTANGIELVTTTSSAVNVQTINLVWNLGTTSSYSYSVSMPANTDFSIRMSGSYSTLPANYTNGPNNNDWVYNTGNPSTNWLRGVQTLTTATLPQIVTAISQAAVNSTTFSISSNSYSRGLSGSFISEMILFPNSVPTGDRQAVEGSQFSYYNGILESLAGQASAAFSLRRLRVGYAGAAASVRRSLDNSTQDILFNADGTLNTGQLLGFVGGGSGYISTWYDQSGNGNHATQTTLANQPRIVNAGTLDTRNSLPTVYFGGTQYLNFVGGPTALPVQYSNVFQQDGPSSTNNTMIGGASGFTMGLTYVGGSQNLSLFNGGTSFTLPVSDSILNTGGSLISATSGASVLYLNGVSGATGSPGTAAPTSAAYQIGAWNGGVQNFLGWESEVIVFGAALTAVDFNTLYTDQKLFYSTP